MQENGYLRKGEKVSDLVIFLDVRSTDKAEDIHRKIIDKFGPNTHAIAARWVDEGLQQYTDSFSLLGTAARIKAATERS